MKRWQSHSKGYEDVKIDLQETPEHILGMWPVVFLHVRSLNGFPAEARRHEAEQASAAIIHTMLDRNYGPGGNFSSSIPPTPGT
jgi:hypothetical protein